MYMDNFPDEVTNAEIASTELAPGAIYEILVWAMSITSTGGATYVSPPLVLSIRTADTGEGSSLTPPTLCVLKALLVRVQLL